MKKETILLILTIGLSYPASYILFELTTKPPNWWSVPTVLITIFGYGTLLFWRIIESINN